MEGPPDLLHSRGCSGRTEHMQKEAGRGQGYYLRGAHDSKRKSSRDLVPATRTRASEIANDARQIRPVQRSSAKGRWRRATKLSVPAMISPSDHRLGVACGSLRHADPRRPGSGSDDRRDPRSSCDCSRCELTQSTSRRERGSRARSRPLPRRHPAQCSPLAASLSSSWPATARLPHRQELTRPLAMDPMSSGSKLPPLRRAFEATVFALEQALARSGTRQRTRGPPPPRLSEPVGGSALPRIDTLRRHS